MLIMLIMLMMIMIMMIPMMMNCQNLQTWCWLNIVEQWAKVWWQEVFWERLLKEGTDLKSILTGEKKPMKELSAKKNVYKSVTWVSGGPDSRVLIEGSTSTVQQRLRICDGGRLTCPVAPDDDLNYKRPLYDSKVIVRMEELKDDLMLNSLKMRR